MGGQHDPVVVEDGALRTEQIAGYAGWLIRVTVGLAAAATSVFFLANTGILLYPGVYLRPLLLGVCLLIAFLTTSWRPGRRRLPGLAFDAALGLVGVAACVHFITAQDAIMERGGAPSAADLVWGVILALLVMESTRRMLGWALPLIAVLFTFYAIWGVWFPGIFQHKGVSLEYAITTTALGTEGIWGIPMAVVTAYVIVFIIFGAMLRLSGAAQLFFDLSLALVGWSRGGPAKIATVASGFFGMLSGSAVANVSSVGIFTIPLMKRVGFRPDYAGAVETVASVGGQIMPPVMGAAAFIVADFLGVPYATVALAAFIPGVLYYFSLFMMVHFEAARLNLGGLPRTELPRFWPVLRSRGYLLVPPALLVLLLGPVGWSAGKAAFWATLATLATALVNRRAERLTVRRLFQALEEGTNGTVAVALACACAGIFIGMVNLSGLGIRFSTLLVDLSGGNVAVLLVLAMLASLLLGTGLPTTPTYIMLAVLIAPALQSLGVPPLAAHLFIFYFGALADMTPPLAISGYIAAGIAGGNPFRTTMLATRLGIVAYLVPFLFVFEPAYLLRASWLAIAEVLFFGVIGVIAFAAALSGHFRVAATWWERLVLLFSALSLLKPGTVSSLIGLAGTAAIWLLQSWRARDARAPASRLDDSYAIQEDQR